MSVESPLRVRCGARFRIRWAARQLIADGPVDCRQVPREETNPSTPTHVLARTMPCRVPLQYHSQLEEML